MKMIDARFALRFSVEFEAVTGLMIRSGREGEFTDAEVETTGDDQLHINGYVWASLLRRALARCADGANYAAAWGKYDASLEGVSPLWTDATFIPQKDYVVSITPGIQIDRKWGAPASGGLYSGEVACPLTTFPCQGVIFANNKVAATSIQTALKQAVWVIGEGVETIGGGWSYGYGRLRAVSVRFSLLDLTTIEGRQALWFEPFTAWAETINGDALTRPVIAAGQQWSRLIAPAGLADGQLLAIHSTVPALDRELENILPDRFVFTRPAMVEGELQSVPVITGKAIRQAVFAQEIERRLRSKDGEGACLDSTDSKRDPIKPGPRDGRLCLCNRCLWFGSTDGGGIISIGDATVTNYDFEVVHRVQLCEHSTQNIQLFNGEYLTRGDFTLDIIIDHRRRETNSEELKTMVIAILAEMRQDVREEMQKDSGPPGWYRLGATSTCTGQLAVKGEIR